MGQSYAQYVQEIGGKRGVKRGTLKTQRNVLIRVIKQRFGHVPATIERAIAGTNDLGLLQDWFDRAVTISSIDELKLQHR